MTQEEVKSRVSYDPESGKFEWLNGRRFGLPIKGAQVGRGYLAMSFKRGQKMYLHRLAFLYMTGSIPEQVDHINLDKKDNSWKNLRASNNSLNHANQALRSNNKIGYKGVFFRKAVGKYCATLGWMENGKKKQKFLGHFDRPDIAHEAYKKAAIERYGDHFRDS